MKAIFVISFLGLAACSTVESRREKPPVYEQTSSVPLRTFEGCFASRTAKRDVQYLPKTDGGSFTSGFTASGMPRYVNWVVDIADLGTQRRVSVYAVNSKLARQDAIPAVRACL